MAGKTSKEILQGFRRHFLDELEEVEGDNLEKFESAEDGAVEDIEDCENQFSDSDDEFNPVEDSLEFEKGSKWKSLPSNSKFLRNCTLTDIPGPKGNAVGLTDELQLLSFFITDDMISKIVLYTNQQIEIAQKKFSSQQGYVRPTDEIEIRALIGLLYFGGVLKNSNLVLEDLFSPTFGPPLFRYSFSKNRFEFLLSYLAFDDLETRKDRQLTDKFAPFREIWSMFEENCSKYYSPTECVTVDEGLSFHAVKLILLCDANTSYFISGIPCVEKVRKNKNNVRSQYALKLTDSIKGSHRNVTCGCRFSSIELADALQQKNLTFVGSLHKNKCQISPSNKSVGTTEYFYQNDKILVSFTTKTDEKILVLSSTHSVSEKDEIESIVDFYNRTKDGVKVLDKVCYEKTTKRKSRRWPMRYFYSILDLAALNAFVLHKWNKNNESPPRQRTNFLKNLALSLTKPIMERRWSNHHLPKEIRGSIGKLLGLVSHDAHIVTPGSGKRKRCYFCAPSLDRKGNSYCAKCNLSLCGSHKVIICAICCDPDIVESNMEV